MLSISISIPKTSLGGKLPNLMMNKLKESLLKPERMEESCLICIMKHITTVILDEVLKHNTRALIEVN